MKTVPITVWIVPIILLAVTMFAGISDRHGAASLSYGYFTFVRIVVCLAASCIAAVSFRDGKSLWATMFVLVAVLFNPFVPIEMEKNAWIFFDLITVVIFIPHAIFGRLDGSGYVKRAFRGAGRVRSWIAKLVKGALVLALVAIFYGGLGLGVWATYQHFTALTPVSQYKESDEDIVLDKEASAAYATAYSMAEDLTETGEGALERIRAARIVAIKLSLEAAAARDAYEANLQVEEDEEALGEENEPHPPF